MLPYKTHLVAFTEAAGDNETSKGRKLGGTLLSHCGFDYTCMFGWYFVLAQ